MYVVRISTAFSMVKTPLSGGLNLNRYFMYSKYMLNYLQGTVSQCRFSHLIHVSGAVSISFNYTS